MSTLYEIAEELRQAEDLLASGLDEEAEHLLEEWRAQLETARAEKFDRTAAFIRELRARVTARREEAQRFAGLALTDQRLADRLTTMLLEHMASFDLKRIETDRFRIHRQRAGGKPPVEVKPEWASYDPDPRFLRPPELSVSAVLEALQTGEELPWAKIGDRRDILVIR